jgi:hypothetical protein
MSPADKAKPFTTSSGQTRPGSDKLTGMNKALPKNLLWVPKSTAAALLRCYDYPHPTEPGRIIRGYDKKHALRTAKMCAAVADNLGYDEDTVRRYQVACLLHDMGRAGLDRKLFGVIWTWARQQGIPTRPAEWRAAHPDTPYGKETEAFWNMYRSQLEQFGVQTDRWAKEQVEMRLGYGRRQRRILKRIKPKLKELGIRWSGWMEKVALYYYYPEQLDDDPDWVRELGQILVACEQLEAWSNRERGSDYYNRSNESFADAFAYLDSLRRKGQISARVLSAVRTLTARGVFDDILGEARKGELSKQDLRFLRSLETGEQT